MNLLKNYRLSQLLISVLLLTAGWYGYAITERYFLRQAALQNESTLRLVVAGLRGALMRFELVPKLVADKDDIRLLLKHPDDVSLVGRVNTELEEIAKNVGASDVYVLNQQGLTLASSNHNQSFSFIGQNFNYRPYFIDALAGKEARFFALGISSLVRGYYFSAPVRDEGKTTGVVAVKIGVENLEESWRSSKTQVIVTDKNGIMFMTSEAEWLFGLIHPLSDKSIREITSSRRYPLDRLKKLPIRVTGSGSDDGGFIMTIPVDGNPQRFIVSEVFMEDAGWQLQVLTPKAIATGRTLTTMAIVLLLILLAFLAGGLVLQRRARLMRSIELQKQTQDELENRVVLRTHDLNEANHNLKREVEERTQAEERLRSTQQELIQAGKLAALGQMSAALSHELNQPLAAVKSYADNARTYLQRDKTEKASENIRRISEMADRMAELGNHLKNFARRPKQKVDGAKLLDAIEVATRILSARLRNAGVELVVEPFDPDLTVKAGLVRLQQVLINLISNALDAMEKHPGNTVHVDVEVLDNKVNINVRDYGPGIDDEIIRQVFDPFFTTKDVNKGLGLGLSISYNIVQDFGGSLTAANHLEGGAVFTVGLAKLHSIKTAAE